MAIGDEGSRFGIPDQRLAISSSGSLSEVAGVGAIYGQDANPEKRYSPAVCLGCDVKESPARLIPKHISTSYLERQNLTMRMSMRRFTRLTNAFSKKVENHAAAVALYFMYYNFGRAHQTLRVTPAMEAGVANHVGQSRKSLDS